MDDNKGYKITEEDIEVAMRYQQHFDPEHATREDAIAKLEDINSDFHQLAHQNPELFFELKNKVDRKKESDGSAN